MKIIKKLVKKIKSRHSAKCQNDSLRTFFRSEYKRNADAAFQYYKTMNDLNYHR